MFVAVTPYSAVGLLLVVVHDGIENFVVDYIIVVVDYIILQGWCRMSDVVVGCRLQFYTWDYFQTL